jgi:hypothetical protein
MTKAATLANRPALESVSSTPTGSRTWNIARRGADGGHLLQLMLLSNQIPIKEAIIPFQIYILSFK